MNYFENIDGRSLQDSWNPVEIKVVKSKKKKILSDSPYLNAAAPIFSQKAVEVLNEFLDDSVELLDLNHQKSDKFYLINVVKVLDCIDHSKAEFRRFPNGRIMWCEKYAFHPEKVIGQHIFKIIDTPRGLVLVSDEFRDKVLENNLTGFIFEEVWNSDEV